MNKSDRDDLAYLKADVEHIKADVKETKDTVKDFNDKMTKITSKLFNDDETGEEGYISITKKNAVRLTKLENIKIALITFIAAVGSVFGWVANNVLSK